MQNGVRPTSGLARAATDFENFSQDLKESVIFVEAEERVLLLSQSSTCQSSEWGIPGGPIQADETPIQAAIRILGNQAALEVNENQLTSFGRWFARIKVSNRSEFRDTVLEFFAVKLDSKNRELPQLAQWVSMYAYQALPSVQAREQAFDVIFKNRIWRATDQTPQHVTLMKGEIGFLVNSERPLIINLFGLPKSGKKVLAHHLSKLFGIESLTSDQEWIKAEHKAKTLLFNDVLRPLLDKDEPTPLPDIIVDGMIDHQLTKSTSFTGHIFRNYPLTQAQVVVFNTQRKGNAICIPILINVSEEIVRQRQEQDANKTHKLLGTKLFEARVKEFNHRKEEVVKALEGEKKDLPKEGLNRTIAELEYETKEVIVIDLTDESREEVLHRVVSQVNKRLDKFAEKFEKEIERETERKAQERPLGASKQATADHSNRNNLIGGAIVVSLVVGGLWFFVRNEQTQ